MRRRVRESSVSRKPVSLNEPVSPSRHEIATTGSTNDTVTDQPALLRMKFANGALIGCAGAGGGVAGGGALGANASGRGTTRAAAVRESPEAASSVLVLSTKSPTISS